MTSQCFIACSHCVVMTNECFIAGSHCVVMTNEVRMRKNVTDYVMHARECQNAQQDVLCVLERDACVNGGLDCIFFFVLQTIGLKNCVAIVFGIVYSVLRTIEQRCKSNV